MRYGFRNDYIRYAKYFVICVNAHIPTVLLVSDWCIIKNNKKNKTMFQFVLRSV